MPAQSKQQQKFMGMVHALKKGDMDPSDASPELKKAVDSMSSKAAKDYASTQHKGLPKKVKQEIVKRLKEYANKMGTNTMGGDDYTSSKKGGLRDNDGYDNVDYNRNIPNEFETEASGGITLETIRDYAETGVNYISVGALTHSAKSLDMSLKALANH
jgi:nicotinate-nucleotide pyrophosphorylase (carboxylating)